MKNRARERGSALIFILIAVGLFAALAFAISQGGRDSTTSLSADKQKLLATEIIDYGGVLKNAVSMLRLRGVAANNLSFAHPGGAGYGTTPTAEIFNPAGGAVVYAVPAPDALTSQTNALAFSSSDEITGVGSSCGALTCAETVVWVNNVKPAVCAEINNLIGVNNDGNDPPASAIDVDNNGTASGFNATFNTPAFTGKLAGCGNFGGLNSYYQVLVVR